MKLRLTPLDDCESHSLTSRTVRNIECCLVNQFELAFYRQGVALRLRRSYTVPRTRVLSDSAVSIEAKLAKLLIFACHARNESHPLRQLRSLRSFVGGSGAAIMRTCSTRCR